MMKPKTGDPDFDAWLAQAQAALERAVRLPKAQLEARLAEIKRRSGRL